MATPLYAPINVDIAESAGKVTVPWRNFFQSLNNTMSPVSTAITQLTGDVTAGPGPGSVAATIANLAVTTGKVADDAITYAKIQNVSAASRLLGRGSAAGAGDVQEITVSTGLTMSGTTLTAAGSGGTVTNTGTLTANNLILGNGGVDVKPLGSLGTTTTVYHGNAGGAGTFGAVSLTADVSGILPAANYESMIFRSEVTLTNAQIKALPTTPITVIPAVGGGLALCPIMVALASNFTVAYSGINATIAFMWLQYGTNTNVWSSYLADDAAVPMTHLSLFLASTTRKQVQFLEFMDSVDTTLQWGTLMHPTTLDGDDTLQLLMDNNGTGNLTGGDAANTLKVTSWYTKVVR